MDGAEGRPRGLLAGGSPLAAAAAAAAEAPDITGDSEAPGGGTAAGDEAPRLEEGLPALMSE